MHDSDVLDELKKGWHKNTTLQHSYDELAEIALLRTRRSVARRKKYLLLDLIASSLLTIGFISLLYLFDFSTLSYWSLSLLALFLIHTYWFFIQNRQHDMLITQGGSVRKLLKRSIEKMKKRNLLYTLWPGILCFLLFVIYQVNYGNSTMLATVIWGVTLTTSTFTLAYFIGRNTTVRHMREIQAVLDQLEKNIKDESTLD